MSESLRILGLDHVAIAVEDLEAAARIWSGLLGGQEPTIETVDSERVRVAMFPLDEGKIELIAPASEDSPITRFLERRGGGIHHLCLRVVSAQAAWDELSRRGVPLLGDGPHEGAGGARIFFLHPSAAGGVLVEIREVPE
jgi:methylmalonyl-CoA epimerase